MKAGNACKGKLEISGEEFAAALEAAIGGIKMRGKSAEGEKTMLDALCPAHKALTEALADGKELKEALADAAEAAAKAVPAISASAASAIRTREQPLPSSCCKQCKKPYNRHRKRDDTKKWCRPVLYLSYFAILLNASQMSLTCGSTVDNTKRSLGLWISCVVTPMDTISKLGFLRKCHPHSSPA